MTPTELWLLIGGAVVAYYALACWWRPYAKCWCCRGGGKHLSKSGKTFRSCLVCGGRGSYFRFGRTVWHWFRGRDD